MSEIRFLWRTDVHLADKTPRRRTGNWSEDVFRKLEWIGSLAEKNHCDFVLDGGDFFDVKSPHKNSHSLVRRTCEIHRKYPCPTYALVGNHDVKYGNISYLPQQPLSVLFSSGIFNKFGDNEEIIIEKENLKIRVVGIPYHGVVYDFDRISSIKKNDEDYLFVACHLLATKGEKSTMFEGEDIVGYNTLEQNSEVDGWFFGHWHKDQGISTLKNGSTVVNVGSLTRGSLHLDDFDRKPCAVEVRICSDQGISYERHDVPVRPFSEAFNVSEALVEKEDTSRVEEIVNKMKVAFSVKSNKKTLKEKVLDLPNISEEVKEIILNYLEESS